MTNLFEHLKHNFKKMPKQYLKNKKNNRQAKRHQDYAQALYCESVAT